MGSLGEEDLEKLVIDYIESPITFSGQNEKKLSRALITLKEILETKGEEEKEIEEKINSFMKRRRLSYEGDNEKRDVMKKIVSKLRSIGYDASLSKTSWDSSFDRLEGSRVFRCSRKYEYIDVMMTSDHDNDDVRKLTIMKRIIIDLDFKAQFELVKQTKAYKDLTQMLPKVFVATEERLKRVVTLMCKEMKKSMKEEKMYRPPWRTSRYMQAKWMCENRIRVSGSMRGSRNLFDVGEEGDTSSKTTCCFSIF